MASKQEIFEKLNDAVLWGEEEDAAELAQEALDNDVNPKEIIKAEALAQLQITELDETPAVETEQIETAAKVKQVEINSMATSMSELTDLLKLAMDSFVVAS